MVKSIRCYLYVEECLVIIGRCIDTFKHKIKLLAVYVLIDA